MKKLIITVLMCMITVVSIIPIFAGAEETGSTTSEAENSVTIASTEIPETSKPTELTVILPTETTEKKVDAATISMIMSSITAIAAIVAPTVSSIITVKSNEKMKRLELHSPKVHDAVNRMIKTHAHMPRYHDCHGDQQEKKAFHSQVDSSFHEFESACYEVMALVPNLEIHQRMVDYLNILELNLSYREPKLEAMFRGLITAITLETSIYRSKQENTVTCQYKTTDSE